MDDKEIEKLYLIKEELNKSFISREKYQEKKNQCLAGEYNIKCDIDTSFSIKRIKILIFFSVVIFITFILSLLINSKEKYEEYYAHPSIESMSELLTIYDKKYNLKDIYYSDSKLNEDLLSRYKKLDTTNLK